MLDALAGFGPKPALSFYRGKTLAGRLSYGELAEKIDGLARILAERFGVRTGDRVAILAPNRLEVPVLVLALLRLGAVVVPLNPASAPEDWSYILGHSEAKGLSATAELAERVDATARPSFVLPLEGLLEAPVWSESQGPMSSSEMAELPAAVLYTSGTTGNPKGVTLRQRNLIANARSMAQNFGLDGVTQLAVLPLYHAHAFGFGLMSALTTGGHLVFTERLEPFTWAALIRAESIEVTSVVPTLLPVLLAAGVQKKDVPTLRHLMVSSAPLPVDLARDFEARTELRLTQGWGLSEYTNFACCASPFVSEEEHQALMFAEEVPSIGPALEGTEVRVIDPSGDPAGEGQPGELQIRGPSTMLGYFKDPANTANTIDSEGWLHTGDEGLFRRRAGRPHFFVTGRLKEIIIRDAEKLSPLRLERPLIAAAPELARLLVVLGFPHREHGEEVGLYVQVETLDDAAKAKLTAGIQTLPFAERPKVVLFGSEPIPRTHTGKIQRRKMQPWFAAWARHRGPLVIAPLSPAVSS